MPDSVVNVSAASSIACPVPTVYFAPAGALEVSGRILSGKSRSETSQERVGCGLPRAPPAGIVHEARPRAGNDRVFLRAARALAFGSQNGAGSRRFFPKKVYYGGAPGLESGEIEKDNISITYALPFSRTIPVRTPQSASRTEESKSLMSRSRGCYSGFPHINSYVSVCRMEGSKRSKRRLPGFWYLSRHDPQPLALN